MCSVKYTQSKDRLVSAFEFECHPGKTPTQPIFNIISIISKYFSLLFPVTLPPFPGAVGMVQTHIAVGFIVLRLNREVCRLNSLSLSDRAKSLTFALTNSCPFFCCSSIISNCRSIAFSAIFLPMSFISLDPANQCYQINSKTTKLLTHAHRDGIKTTLCCTRLLDKITISNFLVKLRHFVSSVGSRVNRYLSSNYLFVYYLFNLFIYLHNTCYPVKAEQEKCVGVRVREIAPCVSVWVLSPRASKRVPSGKRE